MFNRGEEILVPQQMVPMQPVFIKILEQPAPKGVRFRYPCEGRSAGSIPCTNSTPDSKSYPTIKIVGFQGKATVRVSCVTKDFPHRPHPHNLVGKEGCMQGICELKIPVNTMTVQFSNLGIQCVKRREIENSLRMREEMGVDPFRTGFSHRNQSTLIDLNTLRLCFEMFLEGDTPGEFTFRLQPVVSEPICDKKTMSDLSIIELSHCVSRVDGGNKIILLCEKVAKENIQVRFYEGNSDWEAFADFIPSQVHKQVAISFKTPRYKTLDITEPVKVFIQLRRPSDGAISESLPFELWPSYLLDSGSTSYDGSVSSYGAAMRPFGGQASSTYAPNISMSSQVQPTTAAIHWNITRPETANPMVERNDPLNLDSDEIKRLASTVDPQHFLPDFNMSLSLSLSDTIPTVANDMNMTDSLTRITNMALNKFY